MINVKATRVGASECGQRTSFNQSREAGNSVLVNGARGTRDIEGKMTRVGASERGQRTSFKTEAKPFTRPSMR